jgi:SpoVK/Ycf46/Vps4 family AAA+-type ATPase
MISKRTFTSSLLPKKGSAYIRVKPSPNDQLTQFSPYQQAALQNLVKVGKKIITSFSLRCRTVKNKGVVVLFSGASGTGKTMAAKALAREWQTSFFVIDTHQLTHRYIGETEKNLVRVLKAADSSGPLLFFDEADALFGKRTQVKDSHDRYANQEVSYLFERLLAYQGVVILSANRKGDLIRKIADYIPHVIRFSTPPIPPFPLK